MEIIFTLARLVSAVLAVIKLYELLFPQRTRLGVLLTRVAVFAILDRNSHKKIEEISEADVAKFMRDFRKWEDSQL